MREYIVNPLARVRVEDVMQRDVPAVPADMTVDALFARLAAQIRCWRRSTPGRSSTARGRWSG